MSIETELKIKSYLRSQEIQGCIINSPENFFYITNYAAHQLSVSRNPYFASIIMNNFDESKSIVTSMDYEVPTFQSKTDRFILKPYDTWVGVKLKEDVLNNINIHENKDNINIMQVIEDSLKELGLFEKNTKIGIEMDFINLNYYNSLINKFSHINFVDISKVFIQSRIIKTTDEISKIRDLTKISDEALNFMSKNIKIGISEKELLKYFRKYVVENSDYIPSDWTMLGFGLNSARLGIATENRLKNTDSIRFDGGVNAEFDFYTTDFSRSWLMPEADMLLKKIKPVLYDAQRKMIESIKPGLKFNELFKIGYEYVKKVFPVYTRGHLGHSISIGPQTAEEPFINKDNTQKLKEGMILAVEVPFYIKDLGGFNIEDMVLVTKEGSEVLTSKTPHFLDFERYK